MVGNYEKPIFVLLPFADSFGEHSEEVAPDTPWKVYTAVIHFLLDYVKEEKK